MWGFYENEGENMLKTGDYVVHSMEGVCEVLDVVEMKKGREMVPYYQLCSWPDKRTTVYVPVNQENGRVRLRALLTQDEVKGICLELQYSEVEWVSDIGKRQEQMLEILREGDPARMARMTKMLMQKDLEKPLGSRDKSTLLTAQKVLFSEIAMATGQEFQAVQRAVKQSLKDPGEPLPFL